MYRSDDDPNALPGTNTIYHLFHQLRCHLWLSEASYVRNENRWMNPGYCFHLIFF